MRRCTDYSRRIRIVIVDDNHEHLRGVKELLSLESIFDVVGTSTNANTAMNIIKKQQPDVVLMDMNMPDKDGLTAIQEIEQINSEIKVIALTAYDDADLIYRAMKVGAKSYILKAMASSQLIYAINEVAQGKVCLPTNLSTRFFDFFQKSFKDSEKEATAADSLLADLTSREEEVLDLLTQGNGYKDVANILFISETTVKTHVNNIFQKLQVKDRTQAVLYALNNGFVSKRKMREGITR